MAEAFSKAADDNCAALNATQLLYRIDSLRLGPVDLTPHPRCSLPSPRGVPCGRERGHGGFHAAQEGFVGDMETWPVRKDVTP
jgi:hypothetical protein